VRRWPGALVLRRLLLFVHLHHPRPELA
jgi:hypothetical protein